MSRQRYRNPVDQCTVIQVTDARAIFADHTQADCHPPPLRNPMNPFSKAIRNGAGTLLLTALSGCGSRSLSDAPVTNLNVLTEEQLVGLTTKKIFFGHRSVGNNIVQGIKELANADPRLKLNIVKSSDPQAVSGPAFVEFEIGHNGDPRSKLNAFSAVVDKGLGAQGGIAIMKFCYVDIDFSTDIPKLFAAYRNKMGELKARYPGLKIVHVTVPLTTVKGWSRARIKALLRRGPRQDLNVKRNEFNKLMRQSYAGTEPFFDLAEIESTHADGSRSYFMQGGETIYTLCPEFTADGGHLNEMGRQVAAARLLLVIARL